MRRRRRWAPNIRSDRTHVLVRKVLYEMSGIFAIAHMSLPRICGTDAVATTVIGGRRPKSPTVSALGFCGRTILPLGTIVRIR